MADICIPQYSTKFPPTEPLDACYSSVVPTSTVKYEGIQHLKTVLKRSTLESEAILPLLVPSSSFYYPLPSTHDDGEDSITLSERIKKLQERLSGQIVALQRSIHIHEQHLKNAMPGLQSLVTSSRECPSLAACVLNCTHNDTKPKLNVVKTHITVQCAGGKDCTETALPFTRFCLKHINCDSSQVLYRSCQAIDKQSLTQCRDPVLDILSEEPVCHKHMSSQDVLKPPPRKKQHLSQGKLSKLSAGAQNKARRGASAKEKGAHKGMAKNPPPKPSPLAGTTPVLKSDEGATPTIQPQQAATTENGTKSNSRPQSKSLDDLLTLSSFPPLLPTLDLPPLKADIGEIMMAGEDSFSSDEADTEHEQ